jgi:hypothetical protein
MVEPRSAKIGFLEGTTKGKKVRNIEPHLMDSQLEIERYLTDLLNQQRIHEVSEHLSRVAPEWKEAFIDRAKELGWAG